MRKRRQDKKCCDIKKGERIWNEGEEKDNIKKRVKDESGGN